LRKHVVEEAWGFAADITRKLRAPARRGRELSRDRLRAYNGKADVHHGTAEGDRRVERGT
jgi:hypothetical protein